MLYTPTSLQAGSGGSVTSTAMRVQPPLSLGGTSLPNTQEKVKIIMPNPSCVFGGEPIEGRDGKPSEGWKITLFT
jgi:hypothetical protein